MPTEPSSSQPPAARSAPTEAVADLSRIRTVTSASLLQGETEILITHGEDVYRLRVTRNGKLILQK
jgi:hemin uptake protein HemP